MKISSFSLFEQALLSPIVKDYLDGHAALNHLHNGIPSLGALEQSLHRRQKSAVNREALVEALTNQHSSIKSDSLSKSINALKENYTFTITTGHQLCLATGPLYFIYKISSAIKLSRRLKSEFPQYNFTPIYWMASEDHDFEEINHAVLFNKRITWNTEQQGAVGRFNLNGVDAFLEELSAVLGTSEKANQALDLLKSAYQNNTLASATRELVYSIFGMDELIIVDADDAVLKKLFAPVLKREFREQASFNAVKKSSTDLIESGYKAQVEPREINVFYLEENRRTRITAAEFDIEKLEAELEIAPEKFSPNVVLRPVYQELILPNIAYIGGPGEIAYWLQLKGVFDLYEVPFPTVVLRDSALLISPSLKKKLDKLQLTVHSLFQSKKQIVDSWLAQHGNVDLTAQKQLLDELFRQINQTAIAIDSTLGGFVSSEYTRQLSTLDNIEKKMVKALKTKEEVRIQQLEKILSEVFPDGNPQERVVNYFQFADVMPENFISELIESFDPLKIEMKIVEL
jgi:bacillithiol biosynthesis cysteine-adding enzyme BshC